MSDFLAPFTTFSRACIHLAVSYSHNFQYCFTEFLLPADKDLGKSPTVPPRTWAWPSFLDNGYSDDWCRSNTTAPVMPLQGHSSPLGLTFFEHKKVNLEGDVHGCEGGFPESWDGDAFMAFHGSWNRDVRFQSCVYPSNPCRATPDDFAVSRYQIRIAALS